MKIAILYRPDSEHDTQVQQFVREYKQRTGHEDVELISLNTRDGAAMASLYDVVSYPGLVALGPDGVPQKVWQGGQFPLIDELSYYSSI